MVVVLEARGRLDAREAIVSLDEEYQESGKND
jgi:hypothetical protein